MKVNKMNIMLGIIGIIVLLIVIKPWGQKDKSGETKTKDNITIGFCVDNLVIERWQRDLEIVRAKAKENGVEVIVYNANENNETQNRQIQLLIEKKVDVMIIIPYDKDGIAKAVNDAKREGIKVIAYDRLIKGGDIDAYISFDNIKVGQLQAQALVEQAPEGNYVIINGSPEDNNSSMLNAGYKKVLQPYLDKGVIKIVEETWAEKWREEPAYDVIADVLDKGEKIDAIIAANDRLAEAAIRALAEKGLAGKVLVAGHDADISACQRIVEGTQFMTVYKPIKSIAEMAVDLAIQLVKGQSIEAAESIDNGSGQIPFIKLDVIKVTKENMEETVIADGFHKKEDVYRE